MKESCGHMCMHRLITATSLISLSSDCLGCKQSFALYTSIGLFVCCLEHSNSERTTGMTALSNIRWRFHYPHHWCICCRAFQQTFQDELIKSSDIQTACLLTATVHCFIELSHRIELDTRCETGEDSQSRCGRPVYHNIVGTDRIPVMGSITASQLTAYQPANWEPKLSMEWQYDKTWDT